jgi:transposase
VSCKSGCSTLFWLIVVLAGRVELTVEQRVELRSLINSPDVPATVATRARIVLWWAEGRQKKDVAALAGVSRPTVDLWLTRYRAEGLAGLLDQSHAAPREQVPAAIRSRILAATRVSPPAEMGLSYWSSRQMAAFITRTEGVSVSHQYVAQLWRENGLVPHRHGTFKLSKDPAFAEKVADIVGLYLSPPGGAVVLSIDEKTGSHGLAGQPSAGAVSLHSQGFFLDQPNRDVVRDHHPPVHPPRHLHLGEGPHRPDP